MSSQDRPKRGAATPSNSKRPDTARSLEVLHTHLKDLGGSKSYLGRLNESAALLTKAAKVNDAARLSLHADHLLFDVVRGLGVEVSLRQAWHIIDTTIFDIKRH